MQRDRSTPTALMCRWQRLQLHVRCALQPDAPALVRLYLSCGTLLARRGELDSVVMQRRQLTVLLQTAQDDGVPWFWRSVCVEHTAQPLARLSARLRLHDPRALAALEAAVQQAIDCLPCTPAATLSLPAPQALSPPRHGPQRPLSRRR